MRIGLPLPRVRFLILVRRTEPTEQVLICNGSRWVELVLCTLPGLLLPVPLEQAVFDKSQHVGL